MSNYIIELASIHTILIIGYWFLLRKEQQFGAMRFYMITATLLAILIPLFELPDPFYKPVETTQTLTPQIVSGREFELLPIVDTEDWSTEIVTSIYAIISFFFLFSLTKSVMHIVRIKSESSSEDMSGTRIRKVSNLKGSFSFFNWIFLSDEITQNPEDYGVILKHEKAHTNLGHTYDLLFFELFKVCFWWLPTAWYAIKEIKIIHEYQADNHAMETCGVERYSSILISSTLKTHGLSLASSFHDSLILKRLKAMKEQKKKVSLWKLSVLSTLLATLFVTFACTEEVNLVEVENAQPVIGKQNKEVFTVVEEVAQFPGGTDAFYSYLAKEVKYPKQARIDGIEGKVWAEFVIERDGSVADVKVVKGLGSSVDEEVVRVLEGLPDFKPASQRGRTVRVKKLMPVIFKLNSEENSPENFPVKITFEEIQNVDSKLKIEASYADGAWTGTIYDEATDEELPGVSIMIAGTTQGTVSDFDGKFSLTAAKKADIAVSYMGYKSVKLKAEK